ncbi:DUF1284 domain-containing protein [Caldicellulosiruptor morganii]|uniref:DUF1284 domain-containing protein n=1 Tax=Caldicellulosiruptor morganii TaxID=1387555 RepID=A0ABY7BPE6_9FIRM|nr:DUF1284 domain-containing protein [Caldicellulosiruptor morganii]WAM33926.1 DUF1284 domain-containing protein [Caldicellulosiruptor morganii]
MELRFHHLLCFLGFRGLGYSEEFIENFKKVYQKVFVENHRICLVIRPDVICMACPELIEGRCKSEEKVKRIDEKLMNFLLKNGIHSFENVLPGDVYKVIQNLSVEEFEAICKDCEWFKLGFCTEGFLKLKDRQNLKQKLKMENRSS